MSADPLLTTFEESVVVRTIRQAEVFGHEALSDGTELFGHVPHIAPEAWFHTVYPGVSAEDLRALEERLGVQVPVPYAQWLQFSNGLNAFADSLYFYGRRQYVSRSSTLRQPYDITTPNLYERPVGVPPTAVIVGGYSWDGSLLWLTSDEPSVHRCDREDGIELTTWSTFDDMLTSEFQRLASLFDERGRKRHARVPTVP